MRRIAMGLVSGVLGAGVMFGYMAAVAPAVAQDTVPPTGTSTVEVTADVPSELVIPEVATATTDVVTTTEPTRTPVEIKVSTEPAGPRTFVVPVDWCPQEDSCYADYRSDGTWAIVEGQR